MNNKVIISLMAVLAFCGCQKKELVNQNSESKTFTAVIEDGFAETKTSIDDKGNVLWKKGNQVSIFNGSTINQQYKVTDASDGKSEAELAPVASGGFVAGSEIDNNVAFYPYSSTAAIAKDEGTYVISGISLPSTQNYAAGSFGDGAFPMVAVTSSVSDLNLKFKNILGCLKLQLKGTASIASISVTGNNNEILCGAASVTAATGAVPSISLTDESTETVKLDCGTGVPLNTSTATSFVIALPPMTMTGGFTVIVRDTEGKEMEIKTTKSQTIVRSKILKMPVVYFEGTDYSQEPFTITSVGNTTVRITAYGEGSLNNITLEYKKGEWSWQDVALHSDIYLTDGESVFFRAGEEGNESFSKEDGVYNISVGGDGVVKVSGNIMSLLDRNLEKHTVPKEGFYMLFNGCKKLIDARKLILPATTLNEQCYSYMFYGCTSLTTAPELPATNLANACYAGMFYDCNSLTSAPTILPATILDDYCYKEMFNHCTSLITAPKLPATTLAKGCYESMFRGCTSLKQAPDLLATTLASECYFSMFRGCTALATAPELPATTLAESCYSQMFWDCISLTQAHKLPATTLASECYYSMFRGCTALATAPELPATTLAFGCYYYMFSNCTSLTTAPKLPATILTKLCYYSMFYGCTSLTTAPTLPAITLVDYCYKEMFKDCTKLNYVKALFTTTPSDTYTKNWLSGVSSIGTFVKSKDATWDVTGANGIPEGWNVEIEKDYLTFTSTGSTSISLTKEGTPYDITLEYKKGGGHWNSYTIGTSIELNDGEIVQFRTGEGGNPKFSKGNGNSYYSFKMSGSGTLAASGNIMSLVSQDMKSLIIPSDHYFHELFKGCEKLTQAPELPATTLAESCYEYMFNGCTNLTTAPALPATTLNEYCYAGMFKGCVSLISAPSLPAETLQGGCYSDMFDGCTSLIQAPELPATNLAIGCYSCMFSGCTSLTQAPELPATHLEENCYDSMFFGCTSLTQAPELPAGLANNCYSSMFANCTSLTQAPELHARYLEPGCYSHMFYGCSKLNYVKARFFTPPSNTYTKNWLSGVSSTGTFVKSKDATWDVRGVNGIPSGWTVQTE